MNNVATDVVEMGEVVTDERVFALLTIVGQIVVPWLRRSLLPHYAIDGCSI